MKQAVMLYLKGVAMGAADVVPGVSGGTIAFISGIYEELLEAIKSFKPSAVMLLLRGQFREFWTTIHGTFLLILLSGIATSVLSMAKLIKWGLDTYPHFIWAFFFGLIVASAVLVARHIDKWDYKNILSLLFGVAIAAGITNLSPASTPEALWFVFLSGAIAICAMILPGISGAFILLLLGKYAFVLDALNNRDFAIIITFIAGAGVGIISFSNVLSWLLNKYRNMTIAHLAGFMIGSLGVVWPWKTPIYKLSDKGHEVFTRSGQPLVQGYEHYLPDTFDWKVALVIALFFVGLVTIFGIERLANRKTAAEIDPHAHPDF